MAARPRRGAVRPAESVGSFVGRRLRRFTMVVAFANLLLCLLFLFAVTRANSTQICSIVDINIQSYIEPLSREIVIGNQEHIETVLSTLKSSGLLRDVVLRETRGVAPADPQTRQCRFNGMRLEFSTPVSFGLRQVAVLEGSIVWIPIAQILTFIGVIALFSLFLMGMATRFLSQDLHRALVAPIGKLARGEALGGDVLVSDVLKIKQDLDASQENAKYAAVANMTQMVAHDVRKPFSMIQIILNNLASARTLAEVREIVGRGAQDIRRTLAAVTGMLTDVMEIGHDTTLTREPTSPRSLVDAAIREACRLSPNCQVSFSATFAHERLLEVDTLKIQRVFSNIVGNALQAMRGGGRIWFRTAPPDAAGMVELTIGNSGSRIDPDDMARLFDAFFTKGKKGGTGLGLAIAKKVIMAHGGRIGCRVATQELGVEFWFTLPVGEQADTVEVAVPPSSSEVHAALRSAQSGTDAFGEDVQAEAFEAALMDRLAGRRLKVLVLDDEALYRNALVDLLRRLERVGPFIDLLVAASSHEALAYAVEQPDIGLFDHDLGPASLNGIQTLQAMRQHVPGMSICIHSNRIGSLHYKEAVEAGAEHFLPKPMSKVHLLQMLCESVPPAHPAAPPVLQGVQAASPYSDAPVVSALPAGAAWPASGAVAVLDDCTFHRNVWIQINKGRPLVTFESPEVFQRYVAAHPAFFEALSFIVTDQHFGEASAVSGVEFARTVIGKPVFLASYGDFSHVLATEPIAGVLPRKTMGWDELHLFCASRLAQIAVQPPTGPAAD